jgi:hypothetical protein
MAASEDCIGSSRDCRALRRKVDRIEEIDIAAEGRFLRFIKLATVRSAIRERWAAFVARKKPLV